jgi:hypothetical protein
VLAQCISGSSRRAGKRQIEIPTLMPHSGTRSHLLKTTIRSQTRALASGEEAAACSESFTRSKRHRSNAPKRVDHISKRAPTTIRSRDTSSARGIGTEDHERLMASPAGSNGARFKRQRGKGTSAGSSDTSGNRISKPRIIRAFLIQKKKKRPHVHYTHDEPYAIFVIGGLLLRV